MNNYTLQEAADRLGLSPAVLRVYIHRKKIVATKRGSMWFIDHKSIESYKRARKATH